MVTAAEIAKSQQSGKLYLVAEQRVRAYAPPPKRSPGEAALIGFFIGTMALIIFTATAGLDLSRYTFASVVTIGLFTLAPAIYAFNLQTKHNEAIKREILALEAEIRSGQQAADGPARQDGQGQR